MEGYVEFVVMKIEFLEEKKRQAGGLLWRSPSGPREFTSPSRRPSGFRVSYARLEVSAASIG
jgi:hypothetical protein